MKLVYKQKADSCVNRSQALPPITRKRGIITRLKREEIVPLGWQYAPTKTPERFKLLVERSQRKAKNRKRYQKRYSRQVRPI